MVETYRDQPNATEVVKRRHAGGYAGCYVIALGTNDPANTRGNVAILSGRIDGMMAHIGETPVLWTTTKTLKDKGPYQNANMEGWNEAVVKACARHSNMRVYDWAAEVRDDWFTSDGIHFNSAGYRRASGAAWRGPSPAPFREADQAGTSARPHQCTPRSERVMMDGMKRAFSVFSC